MLFASSDGCAAITRCCTDTWLTAARSFSVSFGMFCRRLGLMTCAVTTTPSVWPSAGDLATKSVPTTVPAPGRFSTSTGWPQTSCIFPATRRPMMSVAPPGGNGTTIRTGLVGNAHAFPPKQINATRKNLSIDLRYAAARDRVLGVQLPEIVAGALAALRRNAVRLEEIELAGHVAKTRRVEPKPHEAPLALGRGMVGELRSCVHHGVVVDHHHLAALEVEAEPVLGRLGDRVKEVERSDILLGQRHPAATVSRRDAGALIAAAQLIINFRKNRNSVRRCGLLVRSLLAEAMVVVAPVQRLE